MDRVEEALTLSSSNAQVRARLSGTLDLEGYHVQLPAPGVIQTTDGSLLEARLSLFLDAQFGPGIYVFAQARADHGFDPGEGDVEVRMDEFALRIAPWLGRGPSVQVGRFATGVGNWATRHLSWANPFVTAPLPYEHLTGIWDSEAVRSSTTLLRWSHVLPGQPDAVTAIEKSLRVPIVWGPSYADGVAVAGDVGKFRYMVEGKLGSLSSRPEAWRHGHEQRGHPTLSARLAYRPSPRWEHGLSASSGSYLRESADPSVARGFGREDYRQSVLAYDGSFAWHHWQVWAEVFACRFEIPRVGDADTVAYYTEVRHKFTPRFSGALRWNQQWFATLPHRGGFTKWGQDVWRIDFAPHYRFTPHLQLKLQYSLQYGDSDSRDTTRTLAAQLTLRF